MAFFVDKANRRIFDPVRNIELHAVSGGSDGRTSFDLRGDNFSLIIRAFRNAENIEGADPQLPAPWRTCVTWRVYGYSVPPGWQPEEAKQVISDFLAAYKFGHGMPEEQRIKVVFEKL